MKLLFGLILLAVAIIGLMAARPKGGKPRWFVNTYFELPIVLAILIGLVVGIVLTVGGVWSF